MAREIDADGRRRTQTDAERMRNGCGTEIFENGLMSGLAVSDM